MLLNRLAKTGLLTIAIAACSPSPVPTPAPSASPSTPVSTTAPASPSASATAQRRLCGELRPDVCSDAIARVVRQVREMAASPVAVADVEDQGATTRRGGDLVVLVSFQPVGSGDLFMNPPTWVVTIRTLGKGTTIEPWRGGTLPAHYVVLLRQAGVSA
jgi:hypothetical protein